MLGYAGKLLEIDLSLEKTTEFAMDDTILSQYIGGRGLAAKMLWDRLGDKWERIDPLGPENLLLMLTGPLTGFFPGGRVCVSGKSPQSNGIVGSTVGGEFGIELKCQGYDGLVITGRATKPVYVSILDSKVEIRNANHLWGKEGKATLNFLVKEVTEELEKEDPNYGEWKEPSVLYIGPAGEAQTRVAAVMAKWTHAAGYGGYGAVMGSKNLKALIVKGTGPLPEVADADRVTKLIEKVSRCSYASDGFRRWGTGYLGYEAGARTSSEPIKNWQSEWHDERTYGVDRFERTWIKKYWGDFGCPTTCLKLAMPKVGPFKGAVGDNPDYEIQAYMGTNLGIFNPEENVFLSTVMDDLGFCAIQGGNILGFAGELFQRGVLTTTDLGGIDLKWGDADAFASLARKIAAREGIGDILAEGTYRAALKIGELKKQDLLRYAVQEKGIAIGAHGIRSKLDFPTDISYACSVQGGDHTSTAYLPLTAGNSELSLMLHDSGVYCWFNTFPLPAGFPELWEFFEAVTGSEMTPDEWYNVKARRILHIQRATLLLGGPDLRWDPMIHDENPAKFYEPLPSGPKTGQAVDRQEFEKAKREYYEAAGWDDHGVPRSDVLSQLGLQDVDRALRTNLRPAAHAGILV